MQVRGDAASKRTPPAGMRTPLLIALEAMSVRTACVRSPAHQGSQAAGCEIFRPVRPPCSRAAESSAQHGASLRNRQATWILPCGVASVATQAAQFDSKLSADENVRKVLQPADCHAPAMSYIEPCVQQTVSASRQSRHRIKYTFCRAVMTRAKLSL